VYSPDFPEATIVRNFDLIVALLKRFIGSRRVIKLSAPFVTGRTFHNVSSESVLSRIYKPLGLPEPREKRSVFFCYTKFLKLSISAGRLVSPILLTSIYLLRKKHYKAALGLLLGYA